MDLWSCGVLIYERLLSEGKSLNWVIEAAIVAATPPNQNGCGFFFCGLLDTSNDGGGIAWPGAGELVVNTGEDIVVPVLSMRDARE